MEGNTGDVPSPLIDLSAISLDRAIELLGPGDDRAADNADRSVLRHALRRIQREAAGNGETLVAHNNIIG